MALRQHTDDGARFRSKEGGGVAAAVCGGADDALDLKIGNRGLSSAERVEDAKQLAMMGLGPSVIAELTGWQHSFARQVCEKVGGRSRGGRMRTGLLEILRVPVLHTTCSRFVMAIEHQMQFWNEKRLTSRVFLGAVKYVRITMPDEIKQVPASALYSIAMETVKRTVRVTCCSRCRGWYAQASLESRLTDMIVYDCSYCRQVAAIIPNRNKNGDPVIPVSLAELNLRGTLSRYPSKGAEGVEVRAVMDLVHSIGSRRAS